MNESLLVLPNSRITVMFCVAGFRPGSRATFVPAKVAKTMLAVSWPFGFPARFADSGGVQTRYAQTMHAFSPVSAALLGHTTRPEETSEQWVLSYGGPTRCAQTRLAGSFERPPRGPGGRRRTLGDEHFRDPDERALNHTFRMIPFSPVTHIHVSIGGTLRSCD